MAYSVAIVGIARLENPYINEWISYHRNIGFDHFYIYDNACGNEEHIDTVLTKENAEVTTVVPAYDKVAYQKQAYNDAYRRFNQLHDYMLFIDIDEFFTLTKHKDVSEYIDYLNSVCPGFQSLRVNWVVYDDNNAITRDIKVPVHEFFTHKSETNLVLFCNKSTKCLISTKVPGMYFDHVHYSKVKMGSLKTCNSRGEIVHILNQFMDVSNPLAIIRHYATKTISEYMEQKLCRGDADGYIVRNINNRFFAFCKKTSEKIKYYNEHISKIVSSKSKSVVHRLKTNADFRKYQFG